MSGETIVTPPFNEEAEQAILGGLLGNFSREILDTVRLKLRPTDFFKHSHQGVFQAICTISDRSDLDGIIDLITVAEFLSAHNQLQEIGGAAYLAKLSNLIPSAANIEYYVKIVQENSVRRTLIQVSGELKESAQNRSEEIGQIIEEAESKIFDINDQRYAGSYQSIQSLIKDEKLIDNILERRGGDHITGVPSGFNELDEMTLGFHPSEMIILGARPSVGKTAFALSIIANLMRKKKRSAFFSLEMPAAMLVERILSSESQIPFERIRKGLFGNKEMETIIRVAGELYEKSLHIVDVPNVPLLELRTQARRLVMKEKVEIIIIDYIGLITPENQSIPRHEQMSMVSRSLKSLARELKIPIIILSQLGRQAADRPPVISDLRESGSIEQDADLVLLLHRREEHDSDDEERKDNNTLEVELSIAKNRNGPTDRVDLVFRKNIVRFDQSAYEN